jgi:phosphotransferase system enzyme I (PtsI)
LSAELRACLRLSNEYTIRILVPLVTTVRDMTETRRALQREVETLRTDTVAFDETVQLGAMVETPAALLSLESLVPHADYVSFGTNDLTQYLMAADRNDPSVEDYYNRGAELVVSQIRNAMKRVATRGKPATVCGELASDQRHTKQILQAGPRTFSVVPSSVPRMKIAISEMAKQSREGE